MRASYTTSTARTPSRRRLGIFIGQILIIAALFAAWQAASGPLVKPLWISKPTAIFEVLAIALGDGSMMHHLETTLMTVTLGYGLGVASGVLAGIALGLSPFLERVLAPLIAGFWSLPKIALLPLFVIFFGIGIASKVALVAIVVFFLVLYSTRDGVRDVDQDLIDTLRVMGATTGEIIFKALLPSALSWIYTGMRISIIHALTTTVVGELLSSNRGLGFLIARSSAEFETAEVFASVIVLVALSLVISGAVNWIERRSALHG